MKLLDRKLLRDMFQSVGLLLTITGIIVVGIGCYVTLRTAYQNLETAKDDYYRRCRMADFWIDLKKIPVSRAEQLARMPGIAEMQTRIMFPVTVDFPHVNRPINGLVLSLPDRDEPALNDVLIYSGDYFSARRLSEVIVNDAFAREHHLYPGQTIPLLLNNRREEMLIVGTAGSSEFVYLLGPGAIIPDPKRFGVFYIKRRFAEEVYDYQGAANQIVGRLTPEARRNPDEVLRRAEAALDEYGVASVTALDQQASNQFLSNEIDGLGATATIVPTIFLVVAALVLNVLLSRLARRQRVTVGTLKALGYGDGMIFRHFLKYGLGVGVAGGLLGCLLGYVLAGGMMVVYRYYFEFPRLDNHFHGWTHAIGFSISLACAAAGAAHASWSMLRLRPAEAMRPERPRHGRRVWIERVTFLWNRLDAGWRVALRNLARSRVRTASSVFAAMMGAGLLVSGFMMIEAMHYLIDFQFNRAARSDVDVYLKDRRGFEAFDQIKRLPGVQYAEPTLEAPCTLVHGPYRYKGAISGLVDRSLLTVPLDLRGRRIPIPEIGILVSRTLAEKLHLERGQTLTVLPVRGTRRPVEMPVVDIVDGYLGLLVYARLEYLSHKMEEPPVLTGAKLKIDRDPAVVDTLFRELKDLSQVESVVLRDEMAENLRQTIIQNMNVMLFVMVIFSGVIFFGSIVNSAMVNLSERQSEVATFCALGYDRWEVGGMMLRENAVVTAIGTLLGLPVGYGLTVLTAWGNSTDLVRMPVVTAPWIWIATLLIALLFAVPAQAVVQFQIHRMNVVEALKIKE